MPILTVIDTTGIQNYIFGSNRLRENIGASEIVSQATSTWAFAVLREGKKSSGGSWETNLKTPSEQGNPTNLFQTIDSNRKIEVEKDYLNAEVIYAGGGNLLILFNHKEIAKDFTRRYTKLLLECAPGLEVVVAHSAEFIISDNDNCSIRNAHQSAMRQVAEKKANRQFSSPLLGMAVTVKCISTGGVASFDPVVAAKGSKEQQETLRDKYGFSYVSAETLNKLENAQKANERLEKELLGTIPKWEELKAQCRNETKAELLVPYEFDNLGRSEGEASFIAVVHTDSNGMGNRIKAVCDSNGVKNSRQWIEKMRLFSTEIYEANLAALRSMLERLLQHIEVRKGDKDKAKLVVDGGHGDEFELSTEIRNVYLPLRPLIFGGEDVAFVCDGRLGLALTAYYLEQTESQILTADKKQLYTRAGIAIVKSHYPFARAYLLAEDLAKSAKKRLNEVNSNGDASALDWHIAMTGLAGDVKEIRRREYKSGKLSLRPLSLRHNKEIISRDTRRWQSWESFQDIITCFLTGDWKEKRNKVKALRDALRNGDDATRHFIQLYRLADQELPQIKGYQEIGRFGWHSDVCLWFDAIEALDLFYPLQNLKTYGKEGEKK